MKPVIKYLHNGEYQYATVKDIGDIAQLQTMVKTDLVGAINSILGNVPATYQTILDNLEAEIDTIASAGLNVAQIAEMQTALDSAVTEIGTELNSAINAMKSTYDQKFIDVMSDYNGKVGTINSAISGINTNLTEKQQALTNLGGRLSTAEINVNNVTQDVDTINGVLSTKVDSTDFDSLESTVSAHGTAITQNSSDIALKAKQSDLDLATGRISDAEASIQVNAQGITSAVKKDEMRQELDALNIYTPNILRETRDWEDWTADIPAKAYVTLGTYQHTKIQEQLGTGGYLEHVIDGLVIGDTYTASVWGKSTKAQGQASFVLDGVNHIMSKANGDLYMASEWQRMSVQFVAGNTSAIVGFSAIGTVNGDISHFAGGKVETGSENTGWQAHSDDVSEKLVSVQSTVAQQAGQITSIVSEQSRVGADVESHTTSINQMTDSIELQAQSITDIEGSITSQQATIDVHAGEIALKVEQTNIDDSISGINLDTRNYILNSDMSRVDTNGNLEDWLNVNEDFYVESIGGKNYLRINRTGLLANVVASASTNLFPASNGDRLMIGMDFRIENLALYDIRTVFILDLYDINGVRVYYKEYQLSDLGVTMSNASEKRINVTYPITRTDVAKAGLRLAEYRNGFVGYTNISVQKGDIGTGGWNPAPEDNKTIQTSMKTAIEQNASAIALKADSSTVSALSGDMTQLESDLSVASGQITASVGRLETIDGVISDHSAQLIATADAISTKLTAVQVEDIISGKSYATQSEVTQTASGITSSVTELQTGLGELVNKAEKESIKQGLNIVNAEKLDIDNQYAVIYGNTNLVGTPKTNLYNAKVAYNTGHTNLTNSITAVLNVADTVEISTELMTAVSTSFSNYGSAMATLRTRFEEANKSTLAKQVSDLSTVLSGDISDVSTATTALQNFTNTSFTDGVIQRAEAKSIAQHLNTLAKEIGDLTNQYTNLYANVNLAGTPKTNLASAKTAYDNAYNTLVASINAGIADGLISTAEKTTVDSNFVSYTNALKTLSQRLNESVTAIADASSQAYTNSSVDTKTGRGMWIANKYDWANTARIYPKLSHIRGLKPTESKYMADATSFTFSADYYIGHFYTYVYVATAKTLSLTLTHDDDCTIIVNDTDAYTSNATVLTATPLSIPLKKGWNQIDMLLHEISGGDAIALSAKISTQVDDMSCYLGGGMSASQIRQLSDEIDLRVQKAGVINAFNISTEGIKLDGSKIHINGNTTFGNDVIMASGVIRSADGGTVLDLNNNTFSFNKPFTIGASTSATTSQVSTAQTTAISTASSDATAKANTALTSAQTYAEGQSSMALASAQTYANAQATTAETTAKAYADAQLLLEKVRADAYVDGVISDEEQARITAMASNLTSAKSYADAQVALEVTRSNAYADGVVTAEEQARINEATANLASARSYAESQASTAQSTAIATASSDATTKASTAEANALKYVQSRGESLITNGTGLLGNNTNFSSWTFDGSQTFAGAGSFFTSIQNGALFNDELIPIDPSVKYRASYMAKSALGVGCNYAGFVPFDIDKKQISSAMMIASAYPVVQLAQDLKVGDTKVYLTSLSGFTDTSGDNSHVHSLMMWGYKNSYGYEYPAGTYSRFHFGSAWLNGAINITEKSITLSRPFSISNPSDVSGVFRAGHKLSKTTDGGTYLYTMSGNVKYSNTTWTKYEGTITGSGNGSDKFPHGTGFVKLLFLTNRSSGGGQAGDSQWISAIEFSNMQQEESAKIYAEAVSVAEASLAEAQAKAYADGIVTTEEQARIAEATAKLTEAKNYASAQATTAQSTAISTASVDATSKANTALSSAQTFATTQAGTALTTAQAYTEILGKVLTIDNLTDTYFDFNKSLTASNGVSPIAGYNATIVDDGKYGKGVSNIGQKLYYDKSVLPLAGFTISGWYNPILVHTTGTGTTGIDTNWYFPLVELAPITNLGAINYGFGLCLQPDASGQGYYRRLELRSPVIASGTTSLNNGTWYHITVTFDGARYKVYLNGELEINVASSIQPQVLSGAVFMVGGGYCGKPNLKVDEMYVSSNVLTPDEVRAVYTLQQPFYDPNPKIIAPNPSGITITIS